jgi:1-deoxy-D-xylulose-5-phosphate reductoisomerase
MCLPIHQALVHPEKLPSQVAPLDLAKIGTLSFFEPDTRRFPCLKLAYDAVTQGGTAPAVLNAANEIAVYAFLNNRIGFLDISRVIHQSLDAHITNGKADLDAVFDADRWGRTHAEFLVKKIER